jgi:hypothetical protein
MITYLVDSTVLLFAVQVPQLPYKFDAEESPMIAVRYTSFGTQREMTQIKAAVMKDPHPLLKP